jgi:spermidine/putrescine-binding protein
MGLIGGPLCGIAVAADLELTHIAHAVSAGIHVIFLGAAGSRVVIASVPVAGLIGMELLKHVGMAGIIPAADIAHTVIVKIGMLADLPAAAIAQLVTDVPFNTTDPAQWAIAYDKLLEQKPLIQSYVMDEIFNKMENNEAALAPYYAGDFLSMKDNNDALEFVYPKEGTNYFVDAMCVPKGAQNKKAAELYINFMLEPDIALENEVDI